MPVIYRAAIEWNGDEPQIAYYYRCVSCALITHEANAIGMHKESVYVCDECIKEAFFDIFDLDSIPFMEETKGMLRHSYKAKGGRPTLPIEIRQKVFRRDKFKCIFCGCTDKAQLTIDHIHPYSKGGSDRLSNFQTLCRSCNSKKGNRLNYVP